MSSGACPLCLAEIGRAASFTCPGCGSRYHRDCAADSGACVVVGCETAKNSKRESTQVSRPIPAKAANKVAPVGLRRYAAQLGLIAAFLGGGMLGYISGDSSGYSRGYDIGYAGGYDSGKKDGYDTGYEAGKTYGYNSGYADGVKYGCEWVFGQAGYRYVTAYNPFGYLWGRYPGSVYVSKSNCS